MDEKKDNLLQDEADGPANERLVYSPPTFYTLELLSETETASISDVEESQSSAGYFAS